MTRLPEFDGATGWLNSEPLTAAELSGRVVLVQFWTFTCINWLRTLPYVRAWAEKYKADGLLVVGVHSPEFWFERRTGTGLGAQDLRRARLEAARVQILGCARDQPRLPIEEAEDGAV